MARPKTSSDESLIEAAAGRRLFVRDTHSVTMTLEGEALVEFARNIVETNERAKDYFAKTKLRGRVRFGASEDLVPSWLPEILSDFVENHPFVDFEFTVALSGVLINRFDAGELDIVFWTVRASTPAASSALAQQIFDEAAKRDLHLALAKLPVRFFPQNSWKNSPEPDPHGTVTCLRSVLMKPEHLLWLDHLWQRLDAAAVAVSQSIPR